MPNRRTLLAAAVIAAATLTGCNCPVFAPSSSPANTQTLTRTELFFGLSRPDGGAVSDAQWKDFLNDAVTPRFPDGLTVIDAYGQWQEAGGKSRIAREPSRILIVLHEPTADADAKIEQIRDAYKKRFAQEAVMRTDTKARVSF
jgi:hypothetical protein